MYKHIPVNRYIKAYAILKQSNCYEYKSRLCKNNFFIPVNRYMYVAQYQFHQKNLCVYENRINIFIYLLTGI